MQNNIGRNDSCPCGSGLKYKKCCLLTQSQLPSDDLTWHRMHNTHTALVNKLMNFTIKTYGHEGCNEAWDVFNLWLNEDPYNPDTEFNPTFWPWMLYHWQPDYSETQLNQKIPYDISPAEFFLKKHSKNLDELEIADLNTSLHRHFSFHEVLECQPGAWVKVTDLFTQECFTVIEKMGSKSMKPGDVLYGKVVTVKGISTFDGLAPIIFPPQYKVYVLKERNDLINEDETPTPESLKELNLELLDIFWNLYDRALNPSPSVLVNTDGDLIVQHKMTFLIESIDDAFEALHDLDFKDSREDVLADATFLKNGKLKSVEFPWLKRGNKKNKHWENTVLGHIQLSNKQMIVEVNSKQRSKKFLSLLKKRMSKGWTLKETLIEDVQSQLEKHQHAGPGKQKKDDHNLENLNERPEMKEFLTKMIIGHWENWPTTSLPALNGKTPIEAIKTKNGRLMVEALIANFERNIDENPMPGQTIEIFQALRKQLGL